MPIGEIFTFKMNSSRIAIYLKIIVGEERINLRHFLKKEFLLEIDVFLTLSKLQVHAILYELFVRWINLTITVFFIFKFNDL